VHRQWRQGCGQQQTTSSSPRQGPSSGLGTITYTQREGEGGAIRISQRGRGFNRDSHKTRPHGGLNPSFSCLVMVLTFCDEVHACELEAVGLVHQAKLRARGRGQDILRGLTRRKKTEQAHHTSEGSLSNNNVPCDSLCV
jgi:hypothetical protein